VASIVDDRTERRTAVVCGGTQGIGLATAGILAEQGMEVVILGRDADRLHAAVGSLAARGTVTGITTDATDSSQLAEAFKTIGDHFDYVNILVNAVGPSVVGSFDSLEEADWERAFSEGTLTAVRTIKLVLPLMRRAPWGRIVNVTAMSTQHQTPILIAYTASKAALASITKNLARTLAPDGILVNGVAPGSVLTGGVAAAVRAAGGDPSNLTESYAVMAERFGTHIDLGRVADPVEVAQVVAFCASPANTFMTGAHINVDGGSDFT
jgi:NAD(P)-dependent dehydrogenase (short-subunit alcohol dehydrogenase family)